jgi:hypothetical protein
LLFDAHMYREQAINDGPQGVLVIYEPEYVVFAAATPA